MVEFEFVDIHELEDKLFHTCYTSEYHGRPAVFLCGDEEYAILYPSISGIRKVHRMQDKYLRVWENENHWGIIVQDGSQPNLPLNGCLVKVTT